MTVVWSLAIADLRRDWLQVMGNVAMIVGVILPLIVILAVRGGLTDTLMADLNADPDILRLETTGNDGIAPDWPQVIAAWPETRFVVLKTRSRTDYLRVRKVGGRAIADAVAMTTGAGDPLIAGLPTPGTGDVAISHLLAQRLDLAVGDQVDLVTDAQGRPRQLALKARIVAIAPAGSLPEQRVVLAPVATLDMVEAFYEGFAVPAHGIAQGQDLAMRTTEHEGLRVHAHSIDAVPALAARLANLTSRNIRSEARQIEVTLLLLRNVTRAVGLIAAVALTGLTAALIFAFWAQIGRKRRVIATLSLMGLSRRHLIVFPMLQSVMTMTAALGVALLCYLGAAALADMLFAGMTGASVTRLGRVDLTLIIGGGLGLALISSALAVRSVLAIDTAIVLREAS